MKKAKKRNPVKVIIIILVLLLLSTSGGIGYVWSMGFNPFEKTRTITTEAGEIIDYPTAFVKNTGISSWISRKRGTFEKVEYTTDVYEDGVNYSKYCLVYLPHNYDPDRTEPYNVVYFQHGHTGDPYVMDRIYSRGYLNNYFALEETEPYIIVFTTYYMDPDGDHAQRRKNGEVPAGDGNYPGIPGYFWKEVVQDIIPTVESRYNTYSKADLSDEGIKETRDHRAFSGYSRGGVCTWYMFHNALEYFKWWAPMSGHCTAGVLPDMNGNSETPYQDVRDSSYSPENAYAYLKETIVANPDLDFFIYVTSGRDSDSPKLRAQMQYIVKQTDTFSFGTDPVSNNMYYAVSDFAHSDWSMPYSLYNIMQVFFK